MVNLKVYSFLIFRAEDLWDGDILPLGEGCRGARVRVYLLPVWLEVYGVVFDAFEELVLVCVVAGGDELGYCGFNLIYSG